MKNNHCTQVLSTILAALALAGPSLAADTANSNAVFVGGTPIMRVRVASGGYSPDQRATQIQQRVNTFLGQGPISPDDITVQPSGNEAVVQIKGQLLFTADWATARYNRSTPMQMASMWADHMRRILPGLTQPK
jgi:hypothetical protein